MSQLFGLLLSSCRRVTGVHHHVLLYGPLRPASVTQARFGGSGGSSLHITVTASAWRLPEPEPVAAVVAAATAPGYSDGGDGRDGRGGSGRSGGEGLTEWGEQVRLYSSRCV